MRKAKSKAAANSAPGSWARPGGAYACAIIGTMPLNSDSSAGARSLGTTLIHGARVQSPASRDASSLAVEGGAVTWIGQDAPGPTLFPEAASIDVGGAWCAPAFFESAAGRDFGSEASAAGSGVIRMTSHAPVLQDPTSAVIDELVAGTIEKLTFRADPAGGGLQPILDFLAAAAEKAGNVRVAGRAPTIIGLAAADLRAIDDAQTQALSRFGVTLVVAPLDGDGVEGTDLIGLAASGIPLAGTSWDGKEFRPWDAVAALTGVDVGVAVPARGLSPRAAFTATTRGAVRAFLGQGSGLGVLQPGSPASFALWETGELVTKAADDAVQRWSTDPRSGVPPMPDLEGPAPTCVSLVDNGTVLFDSGVLAPAFSQGAEG